MRPSILVVLSAALVLGAAALVLWPWGGDNRPRPLEVGSGDREIAWLYSANNASTWDRFVTAVTTTTRRLHADGLEVRVDVARAFPLETTAVPELALSLPGGKGRLLFRWYKLTSDWKTEKWVQALTNRHPPPLAILGGSASDPAIELANALQDQVPPGGAAPLLLLTTATADEGLRKRDGAAVPLTEIYAERTFRFCFTNKQMAEAVSDFVWSQEALRPDGDPFYPICWEDDAYSTDLASSFIASLDARVSARAAVRDAARIWAGQAGRAATGALAVDAGARQGYQPINLPERIYCGVGTFDQPNRWEEEVAKNQLARLSQSPAQRPVLVLPAASAQPARRFLRGLMRSAPAQAQRFVVVTGDAIPFSTIYRDRKVTWQIQDLPFDLVLFCHRNPVDLEAGFRIEGEGAEAEQSTGTAHERPASATGTEDVLLFGDMIEALVQSTGTSTGVTATGDELGKRLREARWLPNTGRVGFDPAGIALFDDKGNRRSGTGEHIVWLQPSILQERIRPQADITVWSWVTVGPQGRWQQVREPLRADYE
jgi:hypothetical protein